MKIQFQSTPMHLVSVDELIQRFESILLNRISIAVQDSLYFQYIEISAYIVIKQY